MNWTLIDFITAGVLLFGTGFALNLVTRKVNKKYRLIALAAIIIAFLLTWVELAVGIFGTPFAGS
jgi:hypothetical protein